MRSVKWPVSSICNPEIVILRSLFGQKIVNLPKSDKYNGDGIESALDIRVKIVDIFV